MVLGAMLLASAAFGQAQTPAASHMPLAVVQATRIDHPPVIDGRLTDEAWELAQSATEFTQKDPDEGQPASERTDVRVVYDDLAVYVGIRLFDRQATLISGRMSSRDADADADWVSVYLDPMHDHKTGVLFRVSASNVQSDNVIFNDQWDDSTWDAVWQSATSLDGDGWSAEIRIPLSQLRFTSADRQTWGFNVARFIRRKNETSWLELTKKTDSGLASRMAHLQGLDGLKPKRHLELSPYTAAREELIAPGSAGDPFNNGSRAFASVGLDAKYGITSNLTLDGTVNPDFGQVEVDPAVVNLSAFETFFDEKRPFFLEGAQTFNNFGRDGATDNWGFNSSDPNIFYSRRIGRAPQISPSVDFIDAPHSTTILGAAKITGKTAGGWTLAALDAVTDRETARVRTGLISDRTTVEPLTNYFAARLQRTIGRRGGAGLIATMVARRLDEPALADALTDQAYVVGGDGYWFLSDARNWVINGKVAGSRVSGGATAIDTLQEASQRYFQRPDAPEVSFNPARTSLAGYNGRVNLNRNSGTWRFNGSLWAVSPGFEVNDLGFMGRGDRAGAHAVTTWRKVQPDRLTRSRSFWVAKWYTWNFGHQIQGDGLQGNANATLNNYTGLGTGMGFFRRVQDDRLTRGGPSAANPSSRFWFFNVNSDQRKPLSVQINTNWNWSESANAARSFAVSVSVKPSSRLTISTGPEWDWTHSVAQYIDQFDDPTAAATFGRRYVFGAIDQKQLTLTTRVSAILTPRVSLQLFAQPLLASGDYSDFKAFAAPRTYDFSSFGNGRSTLTFNAADNQYTADPDGNGSAPSLTFDNPDFNIKSLRANAVFRWELKPGSNLYVVWTRMQEDDRFAGDFRLGRDLSAMFSARGDDVFLVKIAYWIGR